MSMQSQIELKPRRIPIQERGEKRVAELLRAAAAIFAKVLYLDIEPPEREALFAALSRV